MTYVSSFKARFILSSYCRFNGEILKKIMLITWVILALLTLLLPSSAPADITPFEHCGCGQDIDCIMMEDPPTDCQVGQAVRLAYGDSICCVNCDSDSCAHWLWVNWEDWESTMTCAGGDSHTKTCSLLLNRRYQEPCGGDGWICASCDSRNCPAAPICYNCTLPR